MFKLGKKIRLTHVFKKKICSFMNLKESYIASFSKAFEICQAVKKELFASKSKRCPIRLVFVLCFDSNSFSRMLQAVCFPRNDVSAESSA